MDWEKARDGQFIRGGWWCAGRVHHHRFARRAAECERGRGIDLPESRAEVERQAAKLVEEGPVSDA